MKRTEAPKKQPIPFGINGLREDLLPTTPSGDNTASYLNGFPPITMTLKAAGGLPPKGQDMNQILFELSSLSRWASSGALNSYDAAFSASVGGYPKGAELLGDDGTTIYISTIDDNTSNPNIGSAGWLNLSKLTAIAGLSGGANKLPYFTGTDTAALADLTSVGRDILGKNAIADVLTYLGLGNDAHLSGNLTVAGGLWDTAPSTTPARVWSPNNKPSLSTLGVVDATTTEKGIVELATNAEMAAGSSPSLVPTVAAVMSILSKRTFSTSDYIRIPDVPGGLIIQWVKGTASSTGVLFAQMPTVFPNKLLLAGAFEAGAASWGSDSATTWGVDFANSTTTQIIAYARRLFPTTINAEAATGLVLAIGY